MYFINGWIKEWMKGRMSTKKGWMNERMNECIGMMMIDDSIEVMMMMKVYLMYRDDDGIEDIDDDEGISDV